MVYINIIIEYLRQQSYLDQKMNNNMQQSQVFKSKKASMPESFATAKNLGGRILDHSSQALQANAKESKVKNNSLELFEILVASGQNKMAGAKVATLSKTKKTGTHSEVKAQLRPSLNHRTSSLVDIPTSIKVQKLQADKNIKHSQANRSRQDLIQGQQQQNRHSQQSNFDSQPQLQNNLSVLNNATTVSPILRNHGKPNTKQLLMQDEDQVLQDHLQSSNFFKSLTLQKGKQPNRSKQPQSIATLQSPVKLNQIKQPNAMVKEAALSSLKEQQNKLIHNLSTQLAKPPRNKMFMGHNIRPQHPQAHQSEIRTKSQTTVHEMPKLSSRKRVSPLLTQPSNFTQIYTENQTSQHITQENIFSNSRKNSTGMISNKFNAYLPEQASPKFPQVQNNIQTVSLKEYEKIFLGKVQMEHNKNQQRAKQRQIKGQQQSYSAKNQDQEIRKMNDMAAQSHNFTPFQFEVDNDKIQQIMRASNNFSVQSSNNSPAIVNQKSKRKFTKSMAQSQEDFIPQNQSEQMQMRDSQENLQELLLKFEKSKVNLFQPLTPDQQNTDSPRKELSGNYTQANLKQVMMTSQERMVGEGLTSTKHEQSNSLLLPFIGKQQQNQNITSRNNYNQGSAISSQSPSFYQKGESKTKSYYSSQSHFQNLNSYVGYSKSKYQQNQNMFILGDTDQRAASQMGNISSTISNDVQLQPSEQTDSPRRSSYTVPPKQSLKQIQVNKTSEHQEIVPTTQAMPIQKNSQNSKGQTSEFNLHKCDITLSEDNQQPFRLAAGDGLPFNSTKSKQTHTTQHEDLQNNYSNQKNSEHYQQKKRQKLYEKLRRMNLSEIVQNQKQQHPELNQLSNEHLTHIIIQQIISLKESQDQYQQNSNHFGKGFHRPYISSVDHVNSMQAGEDDYPSYATLAGNNNMTMTGQSAAQIINHFNITINHQTTEPIVKSPAVEASQLQSQNEVGGIYTSLFQGISKKDLRSIALARDQALQTQIIQSQLSIEQEDSQNQLGNMVGNKGSSFFQLRRGSDFTNRNNADRHQIESSNSPLLPSDSRSVQNHMIRVRNPRLKRRPKLDTNINHSSSKKVLSSADTNNLQSAKNKNRLSQESRQSQQQTQIEQQQEKPKEAITIITAAPKKEKSFHPNLSLQITKDTSLKKLPVNVQLKTIVKPRINLTSFTKPNCTLICKANKASQRIRKKLDDTQGFVSRPYKDLDIIIITFEGVLGAFLPPLPFQEQQTESLILRPAISKALEDLHTNFKVVILTSDQGSVRQKQILKALNKRKVPFDAFYRTTSLARDNLFTYHTIQKDLESIKLQVIFLTSTKIQIDPMPELKYSDPQIHFSLMPISSGMENLVIMCTNHLLSETNYNDERKRVWVELGHASVSQMTLYSQAISNFYNFANSFVGDLQEHQLDEDQTKIHDQNLGESQQERTIMRNASHHSNFDRIRSTTDSFRKQEQSMRKGQKLMDSQFSFKEPSKNKNLTSFQLLTNLMDESENLYPIRLFQQKVELETKNNTFIRAFDIAKTNNQFDMCYEKLEHFSKIILSRRLEECMMRIKLKLVKIKHAMRNVAKNPSEEKSVREGQKYYVQNRRQPAFIAYQKFNSHYYQEIYDECQVRLPCHPSQAQFEKLQSIYRSLQSRLENLTNNTFPFSQSGQSYYNLMYLNAQSTQSSQGLVDLVTSQIRKRQFVLKESYWKQTQAMLTEHHRAITQAAQDNVMAGSTTLDDRDSHTNEQRSQSMQEPEQTEINPSAEDEKQEEDAKVRNMLSDEKVSIQSQEQSTPRIERLVPDIISWLSSSSFGNPVFQAKQVKPQQTQQHD